MLNEVRISVAERLSDDDSGHDMSHIDRVYALTDRFSIQEGLSYVDTQIAGLAALLHDVDDYKLVGRDKALKLENVSQIMNELDIEGDVQVSVKGIIRTMGYSKFLNGIRPDTLPGMIVSDADMCDAIGSSGIVRCLTYAVSSKGSGVIFDPTVWPISNISAEQYNNSGSTHTTDSFVNHFFEELLNIKGLMMTEAGRIEAQNRDAVMVEFLRHFFEEQGEQRWITYLSEYLSKR